MRHTPKGHSRALQLRACTVHSHPDSFISERVRMSSCPACQGCPVSLTPGQGGATKASSMQIRVSGAKLSRCLPMWRENQSWLRGPSRGEWVGLEPGQEAAHIKYIPGPACRPGLCLCIRGCSRFLGWLGQGGGVVPTSTRAGIACTEWDMQAAPVGLVTHTWVTPNKALTTQ